MLNVIENALGEAHAALERLRSDRPTLDAIAKAGQVLTAAFSAGGRVYSCGNGGSMCDAMHFAEELTGRFRDNRPALPATAISDAGHLSCVANDYGYEFVFSRYVEAHGRPGDCLVAISTSGTSKNVLRAMEAAKGKDMRVIGLTGRLVPEFQALCDVQVCTPGGKYADRVQELHIKTLHILIEIVERALLQPNRA